MQVHAVWAVDDQHVDQHVDRVMMGLIRQCWKIGLFSHGYLSQSYGVFARGNTICLLQITCMHTHVGDIGFNAQDATRMCNLSIHYDGELRCNLHWHCVVDLPRHCKDMLLYLPMMGKLCR